MKVLLLVESATIGGHVISALTTARCLKKRGHEVSVISGEGPLADTFASEFPHTVIPYHFRHAGRQTYFSFKSLETVRALAGGVGEREFEVIHAFDARSYIVAYWYALLFRRIPVAATMCGGISPYYDIPALGRLIVFSEEQRKKMKGIYGWPDERLAVIRNRMQLALFEADDDSARQELAEKGVSCDEKMVMMVTTFLGPKVRSIRQALEAMEEVLSSLGDVRFVVVGGKGEFFDEAREIGRGINERLGREAVVFMGLVKNAYRFLRHAAVVLGQGRSAFEGMGFGKPTLIIGDKGYAGTVQRSTIDGIAYCNFSGRNGKDEAPAAVMAGEIARLLGDPAYAGEAAAFGRDYLKNELDIEAGIERIVEVYRANQSWFGSQPKWKLAWHLGKPLIHIVADNYLNAAKRMLVKA